MVQPTPSIERRRVVYTGRVQGVGFRFTARQIAQTHAVTGFVRNLANGNVELVAEGNPPDLDRLLSAIAAAMAGYIDAADVRVEPATGEYKSFSIAY
jgi:acylphosphatase